MILCGDAYGHPIANASNRQFKVIQLPLVEHREAVIVAATGHRESAGDRDRASVRERERERERQREPDDRPSVRDTTENQDKHTKTQMIGRGILPSPDPEHNRETNP